MLSDISVRFTAPGAQVSTSSTVLGTILSRTFTGAQWHMLVPQSYPNYKTDIGAFRLGAAMRFCGGSAPFLLADGWGIALQAGMPYCHSE
jgi:hypothetical protein